MIISPLGKNTDNYDHRPKAPQVATQHRPILQICGQVALDQKLAHIIADVFLLAPTSSRNQENRHSR